MDFSLQVQFQNFLDVLTQPEGILGMSLLLLVVVGLVAVDKLKWLVLSFLIFVAVLAYSGFGGLKLFSPINELRLYGRAIVMLLLGVLLIPTISSQKGWRTQIVNTGILLYFCFQLIASLRMLFGGDFFRGYFGTLSYALIFSVIGVGVSRWLQTMEHARAAVRCIVFAGIIFCVSSLIQYFIDRTAVAWSGRFFGVSGNANHAAVLLGVAIPPTIYEVITTRRRLLWRILIGAFVAIMIVLLVWTGSRTGFLSGVVGTAMLFRLRLGRMVLAPVMCVRSRTSHLRSSTKPACMRRGSCRWTTHDPRRGRSCGRTSWSTP